MKWMISSSKDARYNLALEEYLFRQRRDDDCILIYVNEKAVVYGRNQNVFEEIEIEKAQADGISLLRRITGGGTVYHDSGNINISFMQAFCDEDFGRYDKFIDPVIAMLKSLDISAELRNQSDIFVEGKKVSGNAQTISGGRILHHGTLLYQANLSQLKKYLKEEDQSYQSKSVKSRRSSVRNLAPYCDMTTEEFQRYIAEYFCGGKGEELILNEEEFAEVQALVEKKYDSWDWNIGKSPDFTIERGDVIFSVKGGKFYSIQPAEGKAALPKAFDSLLGQPYSEKQIIACGSAGGREERKQL